MSDDFLRFAALSGLDAWITREPEEAPCDHQNAEWRDEETTLYCDDCHEELAHDDRDDCVHVSYTEQAGGFIICDYCGEDITLEIFRSAAHEP